MAKRKRNERNDPNVIKIGNKTISLEGYLTKKAKTVDSSKESEHLDTGIASNGVQMPGQVEETGVKVPRQQDVAGEEKISGDIALLSSRQQLPIWPYREKIRCILRQHDVLVLAGETGSGKSTQVPQYLFEEPWCQRRTKKICSSGGQQEKIAIGGMIAVTQPRRVAATSLARRVAREAGTPLKMSEMGSHGLVGYSVRFDHRVPRGTRIKFLTEGMLLQELLRDPWLRQYSAVIVDEVHERSMDVDLLCGFLKQLVSGDKSGRGGVPLKVVAMSATANAEAIRTFFSTSTGQAQFLGIQGRQFPVQIIHTPKPVPVIHDALVDVMFKIHTGEALPGDVLAFLMGQEDIEAAQKAIEERAAMLPSNVPKVQVLPLFGQLSMEAQNDVFKPTKGAFTRKMVLATNIAETSLTVPGVRYVVDCGKAKVKQFRSKLGMETLLAKKISKSSAIQRAGRAGRERAGQCYRLYTETSFGNFEETEIPEILRTDVLSAVLTMKARGIDDILGFPLMDMPDVGTLQQALLQLRLLGAISDEDDVITDTGRKMASLPMPAPFAKALLVSAEASYDCVLDVIDVISCVTAGDDIFLHLRSEEDRETTDVYRQELYRREGDLITYLTTMQRYAAQSPDDRLGWCKLRKLNIRNMKQGWKIRRQLRTLCQKESLIKSMPSEPAAFSPSSPEQAIKILKCFLQGFMLKTAKLCPDDSYQTSWGRHVVAIHPSSVLHGKKKRDAIMFMEYVYTQKSYAKKVSAVDPDWILDAFGVGEDSEEREAPV